MSLILVLVLVVGYLIAGAVVGGGGRRGVPAPDAPWLHEASPWARRPEPTTSEVDLVADTSSRRVPSGLVGSRR